MRFQFIISSAFVFCGFTAKAQTFPQPGDQLQKNNADEMFRRFYNDRTLTYDGEVAALPVTPFIASLSPAEKIIFLPADKMPCLVPDIQTVTPIPNANRPALAVPIPNASVTAENP